MNSATLTQNAKDAHGKGEERWLELEMLREELERS